MSDPDAREPTAPGRPTAAPPRTAFQRWRAQGEGWSPLFTEPLLELALGHLEPRLEAGGTVLDLGTGPGHIAAALHGRGGVTVALDIDPRVLAEGRLRHAGPARLAGDQARLPLRDECVDGLFSFSSFQYSDRPAVLAECRRVLRPGGRIAVVENLAGNPFARAGRWLRSIARTPYPEHRAPREHLGWRERAIYERHFRDVRCDAFHVLTPMLLASRAMASAPVGAGGRGGALYRLLRRADRALLPAASSLAWCVVIRGVR